MTEPSRFKYPYLWCPECNGIELCRDPRNAGLRTEEPSRRAMNLWHRWNCGPTTPELVDGHLFDRASYLLDQALHAAAG